MMKQIITGQGEHLMLCLHQVFNFASEPERQASFVQILQPLSATFFYWSGWRKIYGLVWQSNRDVAYSRKI